MSSYQKIVLLIGLFGSYIAKAQNTMEYWSGSGIVLASEGFIATNYHVVDKGLDFEVDVFTNGLKKTYSATVIKTDKENDLAVIKISDPSFKSFGSLPYTFRVLDIKVGEKNICDGLSKYQLTGRSKQTGFNISVLHIEGRT